MCCFSNQFPPVPVLEISQSVEGAQTRKAAGVCFMINCSFCLRRFHSLASNRKMFHNKSEANRFR